MVLCDSNILHYFRFWCNYGCLDQICCKDHGYIRYTVYHCPTTTNSQFEFRKTLSGLDFPYCLCLTIACILSLSGNMFRYDGSLFLCILFNTVFTFVKIINRKTICIMWLLSDRVFGVTLFSEKRGHFPEGDVAASDTNKA